MGRRRAGDVIINDWDSVTTNRQLELVEPIEKGLVKRETVHERGPIGTGKARLRRDPGMIIYHNTELAGRTFHRRPTHATRRFYRAFIRREMSHFAK